MKIVKTASALLFVVATACAASEGVSPSLLPRAAEAMAEVPSPAAAPPVMTPQPADPALSAKIAELIGQANLGDVAFQNAAANAASLISAGRNAPKASEAWVRAEEEISNLESARARTTAALGAIDALLLQQLDISGNGIAELRAAQSLIEAMANAQTLRLSEFRGR
jgi:hypothetical protein